MRTIIVTETDCLYIIEDWNFAKWRLMKGHRGRYYCTLQGKVNTFGGLEHFLELMYGDSKIGTFINYEVKTTKV